MPKLHYVTELSGGRTASNSATETAIDAATNTVRQILGRGGRCRITIEELGAVGTTTVEEHAGIKIRSVKD